MTDSIVFLTLDEVLALHADQVARYGGSGGIRSLPLLESALAMPKQSFEGSYLHGSLSEMAAAYLFHVVGNHPFVDGNKRIGLMAALAFLGLNGVRLVADPDRLGDLVLEVAAGKRTKAEVSIFIQQHSEAR